MSRPTGGANCLLESWWGGDAATRPGVVDSGASGGGEASTIVDTTGAQGRMLALHNFGPNPAVVSITVPDTDASSRLIDLLESNEVVLSDAGTAELALPAYGYRWLRVADESTKRLY